MRLKDCVRTTAFELLAVAVFATIGPEASACSCTGPEFWQVYRRSKTIIYGVVARHVDVPTQELPRADIVVEVKDVLRGRVEGPTVTFRGGTGGGMDCDVSAQEFPVGSAWVFILDGEPVLGACSGRFLPVEPSAYEGALPLAEVKRRLRYRGPPKRLPTATAAGQPCGASLLTWLDCNNPRIKQYLEGLEPYERGGHLDGVQLSDGRWVLDDRFAGRVRGLGRGVHVYLFGSRRWVIAYGWVDSDGSPFAWPKCEVDRDPMPAEFGRLPACGAFYENHSRTTDVLKPGHVVARCECVPEAWAKPLMR